MTSKPSKISKVARYLKTKVSTKYVYDVDDDHDEDLLLLFLFGYTSVIILLRERESASDLKLCDRFTFVNCFKINLLAADPHVSRICL